MHLPARTLTLDRASGGLRARLVIDSLTGSSWSRDELRDLEIDAMLLVGRAPPTSD